MDGGGERGEKGKKKKKENLPCRPSVHATHRRKI